MTPIIDAIVATRATIFSFISEKEFRVPQIGKTNLFYVIASVVIVLQQTLKTLPKSKCKRKCNQCHC